MTDATTLLAQWREGDENARNELIELVYAELHKSARQVLAGERRDRALQPTELVSECVIRLMDLNQMQWQDRAHFLAMSATIMRRLLVDEARARASDKRRAVHLTVTLSELAGAAPIPAETLAINDALERLQRTSEERARVVELKVFGGMTNGEIAEVMHLSESTIKRFWRSARSWLTVALEEPLLE